MAQLLARVEAAADAPAAGVLARPEDRLGPGAADPRRPPRPPRRRLRRRSCTSCSRSAERRFARHCRRPATTPPQYLPATGLDGQLRPEVFTPGAVARPVRSDSPAAGVGTRRRQRRYEVAGAPPNLPATVVKAAAGPRAAAAPPRRRRAASTPRGAARTAGPDVRPRSRSAFDPRRDQQRRAARRDGGQGEQGEEAGLEPRRRRPADGQQPPAERGQQGDGREDSW